MLELYQSLRHHLKQSELKHKLLSNEIDQDTPSAFVLWTVMLREGKRRIYSELTLNPDSKLLHWRARLVKSKTKVFSWVYEEPYPQRAKSFHALAEDTTFARLRLNPIEGAFLEIAMPLSKSISQSVFKMMVDEMKLCFAMRKAIKNGMTGGGMEWLMNNLPSTKSEPSPNQERPVRAPEGRIGEIAEAIQAGHIDLARRLASGDDITTPDSI